MLHARHHCLSRTQMAMGSEVAFIILFMKYSVIPLGVKKGGNIEKVGAKMKTMLAVVRYYVGPLFTVN